MPKRVFLAVPLAPELRQEIMEWKQAFNDLPVRWMNEQDLHITIVPPWFESRPEEVMDRLARFVPPSFEHTIKFDRVRFGPTLKRPRLVWAEGPTPTEMLYVKQTLERWLSVPRDPRPFRTHLTLARFDPDKFSTFPVQKLNKPVTWAQPIDRVALYESHPVTDGIEYTILAEKSFKV